MSTFLTGDNLNDAIDDIIIKDAGTIGSASTTGAILIAAGGEVSATPAITSSMVSTGKAMVLGF